MFTIHLKLKTQAATSFHCNVSEHPIGKLELQNQNWLRYDSIGYHFEEFRSQVAIRKKNEFHALHKEFKS